MCGLCLYKLSDLAPGSILVADQHTAKEVDIEKKIASVVAEGFQMAFDIAHSNSGVV